MTNVPDSNILNEKQKRKFVKKMMKLANKAKKSSEEEISSQLDKKIRRFDTFEGIFYIITIIVTLILAYFFLGRL